MIELFSDTGDRKKDIQRGKVIKSLGKNMYKLQDPSGRFVNVFSSQLYNVGEYVRIIQGQIVGKSANVTKTKNYLV